MMNKTSKYYLISTATINSIFYAIILLSAISELKEKSLFFDDLFLVSVLFILDIVGIFIGRKILKENPKDKYARLGFIINMSPILALMIYSFIIYSL